MAKNTRTEARIRRHHRVRKNISGTPERPRLNVFRSAAEIYAQVIDDEAGHTVGSASTIDHELRRQSSRRLKKTEQAQWLAQLVAERAKEKGIKRSFLTAVVSATSAG